MEQRCARNKKKECGETSKLAKVEIIHRCYSFKVKKKYLLSSNSFAIEALVIVDTDAPSNHKNSMTFMYSTHELWNLCILHMNYLKARDAPSGKSGGGGYIWGMIFSYP